MDTAVFRGLWADILANPLRVDLRLVLSDYLEEEGKNEWAKFVRVQCQFPQWFTGTTISTECAPPEVWRVYELLTQRYQVHEWWVGPVWRLATVAGDFSWEIRLSEQDQNYNGIFRMTYQRGCIEQVHCSDNNWVVFGPTLILYQPIVKVVPRTEEPEDRLSVWAWCRRPSSQSYTRDEIHPDIYRHLHGAVGTDKKFVFYNTRGEALADYSRACLRYAHEKVGQQLPNGL